MLLHASRYRVCDSAALYSSMLISAHAWKFVIINETSPPSQEMEILQSKNYV